MWQIMVTSVNKMKIKVHQNYYKANHYIQVFKFKIN